MINKNWRKSVRLTWCSTAKREMIEKMESMNKVYEQETMRLGLSCKEFYLRQYKQELLRFLGNIN